MEQLAARNICIVEDEPDLVEALTEYLEIANYHVVSFNSAEEFFEEGNADFKGIYLIDWNLPGESGIKIVEKIRSKSKVCKIFMISAFSKIEQVITGLKAGADDYITKPYSMEELLARVNNASSKLTHMELETSNEELRLLPGANTFVKSDVAYKLTLREFIIFQKLFETLGEPVSRDQLIACFAKEEEMTVRNIDVHVFSLRKKIKQADIVIETVWGHGYKLKI